jgi:hypothetical protein
MHNSLSLPANVLHEKCPAYPLPDRETPGAAGFPVCSAGTERPTELWPSGRAASAPRPKTVGKIPPRQQHATNVHRQLAAFMRVLLRENWGYKIATVAYPRKMVILDLGVLKEAGYREEPGTRRANMRKPIKFASVLFCGVIGIVSVAVFLLRSDAVLATPGLQTALVARYPAIRDSQIDNCTTCHMPVTKDFLNEYGLALKEAKMDFDAVADLDSDEDGRTNIDEINDQRFPGSQAIFPEYYIFHVPFSKEDPELGKVHFNHEMHSVKESMLSKGRCANCHGKDLFPMKFDDNVSVRPLGHTLCWRCHETSGSVLAPKDCTGCHTGIDDVMEEFKELAK